MSQEPIIELDQIDDQASEWPADRLKGGSNSMVFLSLFLALYLLLLAVFILLNSISQTDQPKAEAVIKSVRDEFNDIGGATILPGTQSSAKSEAERTRVFLKEMETAFSEKIELVSVKYTPRGDRMKVTAPTKRFFRDGQAKVNPDIESVLNRIADSLSRRGDETLRYEVAVMVGTGSALPAGADLSADLELRRAGQFAQTLRSMGVPPNAIRVGVRAANPELIEIHFFVRRKALARISFEQIVGATP